MSETIFDNLTGQELKELINSKQCSLEDLDRSALGRLFDYESNLVEKGEGNNDLLCNCAEMLFALKNDDEDYDTKFAYLLKEAAAASIANPDGIEKGKTRIRGYKKALLVAAIAIILIISASLIAGAFGYNILEFFKYIASKPSGTIEEHEGLTYINDGTVIMYDTIEEMLQNEKTSIMYPNKLPEGVEITSVRVAKGDTGIRIVTFLTNVDSISISVEVNTKQIPKISEDDIVVHYRDCTFVVIDDIIASGIIKNNYYSISARTNDELISIIQELKEYNNE